MNYSELYNFLKDRFNLDQSHVSFAEGEMSVDVIECSSEKQTLNPENGGAIYDENINAILQDNLIDENVHFRYPVFVPKGRSEEQSPIILLHGLNERSWLKYLPWGYRLAERTRRAVILFPTAYHINRSPEKWSNPRALQESISERKKNASADSRSSFANIALSRRLSNHPIRFFTSGRQSGDDLIHLISELDEGLHPLFPKGSKPDFFAYSIGAFLAQILFLANPNGIVDSSKLFMFCGGALFEDMNGLSKMIMDKEAFERICHYYLQELNEEIKENAPLRKYFSEDPMGKGFWSMIADDHFKDFRTSRFDMLKSKIKAVALLKDQVIPAFKIKEVVKDAEILDFGFQYTHETPFPVGNEKLASQVNDAFDLVFEKAIGFLR
jgi:pimeloyl-ACP methyl ester carboxylesterase